MNLVEKFAPITRLTLLQLVGRRLKWPSCARGCLKTDQNRTSGWAKIFSRKENSSADFGEEVATLRLVNTIVYALEFSLRGPTPCERRTDTTARGGPKRKKKQGPTSPPAPRARARPRARACGADRRW